MISVRHESKNVRSLYETYDFPCMLLKLSHLQANPLFAKSLYRQELLQFFEEKISVSAK